MPPEVRKFLHDIKQAIELIEQFTSGKSVSDYKRDAMLRSAVERQFMIIGEALQQAMRLMPQLADSISESRRIVNFRNVIVHGYAQIVAETVWGVVEKDLTLLDQQVQRLIEQNSPGSPGP
jgi:uncharacterized protein with HEPN domain